MLLKNRVTFFIGMTGLIAVALFPSWAFAQNNCPADMKEVHVGKAVSCIPEDENVAQAKEKLKNDPQFAELLKGQWHFIRPKEAPAGEFCGALFENKDAMIWLMGPGGNYRGALLRFYGADIPKPTNPDKTGMAKQKITLTQAPDPAQTLTVLNHSYKEFKFGVLSVPVPSLDALIGAIEDEQHFKIEIDGRVVFNSAWKDGKKTRAFLQACAQGK